MHISSALKDPKTVWAEWSAVRRPATTTTLLWCQWTQTHFQKQKTLFQTNFKESLECLELENSPSSCWLDQSSRIGFQGRNQHLFLAQTQQKVCSEQSFLFLEVCLCFLTPEKSCGDRATPNSAPFRPYGCVFHKCTTNVHNRDICKRS